MAKTPIILFAALLALLSATAASAQTSGTSTLQFLMTWKASGSYAPAWYQGKVLPGGKSSITASLEILVNGKPANLKSTTINWYLDNGPIAGGFGLQSVNFTPDTPAPGDMELRVEIPNYNGNFLIHAVDIPVASPKVVIDAPFPNGTFSGSTATVTALPFFFGVASPNQLAYQWSSNGTPSNSAENPEVAQINIPSGAQPGSAVNLAITAINPNDQTTANGTANLTYSNHL